MDFSLDDIMFAHAVFSAVNKAKLETLTVDGQGFPEKDVEEWKFIGLNNFDFLRDQFGLDETKATSED